MGASGWEYFAPYQEDIEQALYALQQEVFKSGIYGAARQFPPELLEQIPQLKASAESLKEIEKGMLSDYGPIESVDDLREAFAEEGTHTIIDIEGISSKAAFGAAYPAPQETIQEVYGATRPSHQTVQSKRGALIEVLGLARWQAAYLIVYEDDVPTEIYFEGVSGD